jgi:hypothetical protein
LPLRVERRNLPPMRRRWVVAGFAVVLAACGGTAAGSSTSSGSPAGGHCGPAGAKTLAASPAARVYSWQGVVYGCSFTNTRSYRLGSGTLSRPGQPRVGRVAVAGEIAAFGTTEFGVDTGSAQVTVIRLSDGKQLRSERATTRPLGPESFQSVDAVVVKADGAVAWIGAGHSIINQHHADVEVHAIDRKPERMLDSGTVVDPTSLRLHGSRLTWKHGGHTRSATLS